MDTRTIIVGYVASNVICTTVVVRTWARHYGRFSGIGTCAAGLLLELLAAILIALRGLVPNVLSITVAAAAVVGGVVLLYGGLSSFFGRRATQLYNYVLLVSFVFLHAYFLFVIDSLRARTLLLCGVFVIMGAQCAWLLLRRLPAPMRALARGFGYVMVVFVIANVARAVATLMVQSGNDFLGASIVTAIALLVYQMFFIVVTLSLLLMINSRTILLMEQDAAARARAEAIISLRLVLWEYAAEHSTRELMQKALDEIEKLTCSQISFYHFVDAKQNALTLQAWSTRTRIEFCKTKGEGMHYSIDQAGVWVDCVRERKPVIHNDYASLPHRRGMPAGHAPVIRELVVPTICDGQVVAVLGVGNKPTCFDQQDVELVTYIADVIWTIVEQKQTHEEIGQLNSKLEELAMSDELTGLPNRRAFFALGSQELKRTQRYPAPLSVIMFDVDRFKQINDTYGHDGGDQVLQVVATTLQQRLRAADIAARLGGEEFVLLLPNTNAEGAMMVAERLRRAIEQARVVVDGQEVGVTVSAGVAAYRPDVSQLDILLKEADNALYQAKSRGRNQVVW